MRSVVTSIAIAVVLLMSPAAYAQSKSADYSADYQQTALEIYRHIISIRSAEGHGNVPELADYLADRFRDGGFDDGDIEVTAAVTKAIHKQHPDIPVIPYMAPYGTDGKHMRLAGMPTYGVMGLFIREEDEFAHGLNERVQVDVFFGALEYWHELLTDLAGD